MVKPLLPQFSSSEGAREGQGEELNNHRLEVGGLVSGTESPA